MNLASLHSGSDVRGYAKDLCPQVVGAITDAFVCYLLDKGLCEDTPKIAVGHDSRLSAPDICHSIIESLKASGCRIYFCGLASTPSMYWMTQHTETDCDASIMVTASHHPSDRNGLKFFTKQGGITSAVLSEILALATAKTNRRAPRSTIFDKDYIELYCEALRTLARNSTQDSLPLYGLKLSVDAGNGAGGFFALRVLRELGADVSASQFLEPDGNFPNHVPNPEDAVAMASISQRVVSHNCDLGIIFDTDVDRVSFVDRDGSPINRNRLIALVSAILLEQSPGATIVTDSVTSDGLTRFITERGGTHYRYKRGYNNVISKARQLSQSGVLTPVAIETSGHAAFASNNWLDDGAYLALLIALRVAQLASTKATLGDLLCDLAEPLEEGLARLTVGSIEEGRALTAAFAQLAKSKYALDEPNFEGVKGRLQGVDGFFLLRMSVHDPIVVINLESAVAGGVSALAAALAADLATLTDIDLSSLTSLVTA